MANEKILATVGGVNITEADIDAFIEGLSKEQKAYASIPQFRQQCLEQLISLQLYALMAEEEKLDETEEFEKMMAGARKEILANLAMKKSFENLAVTEEECKDFYAQNPQHFNQGESVKAKHILVEEEAKAVATKMKEAFPLMEIQIHPLSPVFVTQGGPGCIAVQYIEK